MMPDLAVLIGRWGYGAIFLVVRLGNVGIPVPEETILVLAGYLVFQGTFELGPVLAIGAMSAVAWTISATGLGADMGLNR